MNAPPPAAAPDLAAPEQLFGRVLVVDDELPNRAYLKKILTAHGCEVLEASDGAIALQLVRAHKPDLALVDVIMPGISGYEVCQTIKSDPALQEIPVIMVTARTDITDIERAFLLGASDYIRKPFNPRELIMRVRTALLVAQIAPDEIKLQCSIPPDHQHVTELAADCERVLLKLGWSEEAATAARLLVMEHGANTVDHGQVAAGGMISCQLRVRGGTAGLLFRDPGREWDFDDGLQGARRRGSEAPRGRGLGIIRAIASHLEVFRRGPENIAFYLLSADFNAAKERGTAL